MHSRGIAMRRAERCVLTGLERGSAFGAGEGAAHVQVSGVEVDVGPLQAEQFALAQSGA